MTLAGWLGVVWSLEKVVTRCLSRNLSTLDLFLPPESKNRKGEGCLCVHSDQNEKNMAKQGKTSSKAR